MASMVSLAIKVTSAVAPGGMYVPMASGSMTSSTREGASLWNLKTRLSPSFGGAGSDIFRNGFQAMRGWGLVGLSSACRVSGWRLAGFIQSRGVKVSGWLLEKGF